MKLRSWLRLLKGEWPTLLLFIYFRTHCAIRRGFSRVVVVITNHSHDETGDLYIGSNLCTTVDEVSDSVTWFRLLDSWEANSVCGDSFSPYIGFLSSAQELRDIHVVLWCSHSRAGKFSGSPEHDPLVSAFIY
jgi:hypothetical protein